MINLGNFEHWKWSVDKNNILWLSLDRSDTSANSLNKPVFEEFYNILNSINEELKNSNKIKGLIIQSGKKNGFIAGADITQFETLETSEQAVELIRNGQKVLDILDDLKIPTVALVHGFCLGGGFELALACDYIVAIDSPKTKIGLPEILLGIHPGWGGTVRLLKRTGSLTGLDLVLTGRICSADRALKFKMIDAVVPERHKERAVVHYIQKRPKYKKIKLLEKLAQFDLVRPFIGKMVAKKVSKKAKKEHYPAPYAVIDNWVDNNIYNTEKALVEEANSIGRLLVTPTAKNLVKVFFLREKLKGLAKGIKYKPKHIHVIGAGVMGGGIAAWSALRGYQVTLQDSSVEAISKTLTEAKKLFTKKLKKKHLVTAAMDRLIPDTEGLGVSTADIILEAIVEKVEAKQALFVEIEKKAKKDAIFATNTSTITLDKIREKIKAKEKLVGIHFFNPVSMMPLVEVVYDEVTSVDVKNNAIGFVGSIDKLPLPVKSSPGFLVNRVLSPYLLESITMYEEGIPLALIDKAAKDFGMPLGPVELADTIGLDVCKSAGEALGFEVPKIISEMVKQGKLGRKTGKGLYQYKKGKIIPPKIESGVSAPKDLADRLVMRMINEAIACLREGVVEDEGLLDAGMIFGTGFAPFTGGPMNYIKTVEKKAAKRRLDELAERYGERFNADEGWALS